VHELRSKRRQQKQAFVLGLMESINYV
jgi:hypothetical protein